MLHCKAMIDHGYAMIQFVLKEANLWFVRFSLQVQIYAF